MEQQVAALAGAEEIAELGDAAERRVQQLLPAAADVVRGRAIALRENEGAGGNDLSACEVAVEGHTHKAAPPQQRPHGAPSRHPNPEVMQYPANIDQIECSLDRPDLENIGLGVRDSLRQRRERLPLRVAKTGEAEIDGQHPRVPVLARHLDWMPASAAAGDENVDAAFPEGTEGGRREL